MTDRRPMAEGVGGKIGRRNTPTTMNAALLGSQFWDGRAPSLEAQALLPIVNPIEMGQPSGEAAARAIAGDPLYQKLFHEAYGRAPNYADQRMFSVKINRSSLRVLDLTNNPAWQTHVKPVEAYIKQAPQNYGQTFENFVKANKIDLGQFDAVIAPDYLRGGRQMSILLKSGKPAPLEVSIRSQLQPLTPATTRVRARMPPIALDDIPVRVVGPKGEFMGTAAEVGIVIGITVILTALEIWMTRRMVKQKIEEGLKNLKPKIADRLDKLKPDIAKLQLKLDKGGKVFGNIVVQIHSITYSLGAGRGTYMEPDVRLADINITTKNTTGDRHFKLTLDEENTPSVTRPVDEYTYSVEVQVYTKDQLNLFDDWSTEYLAYNRKRMMDPTNLVFITETRRLREQIVRSFGTDIWYLNLP